MLPRSIIACDSRPALLVRSPNRRRPCKKRRGGLPGAEWLAPVPRKLWRGFFFRGTARGGLCPSRPRPPAPPIPQNEGGGACFPPAGGGGGPPFALLCISGRARGRCLIC